MSQSRTRRGFWWVTLAALMAIAVTSALGLWQLGRADEKLALQAQRLQRQTLPPVDWGRLAEADAQGALASLYDRPVALRGRWLHEATVFLDNRTMGGRVGFVVVTPLLPPNGGVPLLVQRGWVPRRMDDRTALPTLPQVDAEVEVLGRLAPPPSRYYEFAGANEGVIRQNIDLDAYGAEWSLRLLSASVQQSHAHEVDDGLWRDWPEVGSDVHKHYGYAFQWFGLSSLTLILYVWFQIIVPWRRR